MYLAFSTGPPAENWFIAHIYLQQLIFNFIHFITQYLHGIPRHATPSQAKPRHATPRHIVQCSAVPCYVMSYHTICHGIIVMLLTSTVQYYVSSLINRLQTTL